MRAKEMVFDFLETVFFLFCIIFFIFYLFFGGHMEVAKKIVQTAGTLSFFGFFVVIKWKIFRERRKKKEKEGQSDDTVVYLEKEDVIKDRIFFVLMPSFVVIVSACVGVLNALDFLQGFTILFFMNIFHLKMFLKRKLNANLFGLTETDEANDKMVILFLSMLLLVETLFVGGASIVDYIQTAFVYIAMYYWHRRMFES